MTARVAWSAGTMVVGHQIYTGGAIQALPHTVVYVVLAKLASPAFFAHTLEVPGEITTGNGVDAGRAGAFVHV